MKVMVPRYSEAEKARLRRETLFGNQWSRKLATMPLPASRLDSGRHGQISFCHMSWILNRFI